MTMNDQPPHVNKAGGNARRPYIFSRPAKPPGARISNAQSSQLAFPGYQTWPSTTSQTKEQASRITNMDQNQYDMQAQQPLPVGGPVPSEQFPEVPPSAVLQHQPA